MSKAILVVDMPKNCKECRLCSPSRESHTGQFCWKCAIHPSIMIKKSGEKPEWCPLMELPKKKRTVGNESENDELCMNAGWNNCIDELLKDNQ